jgi:hypothetical protein
MAIYRGGCHCGRIRFEVEGTLERVTRCNCSICARTGYLHWTVEPERVRLLTKPGDWATYRFGTRTSENRFCATCGVSPFRVPRSDPDKVTVNARCLEGVDVDALELVAFDGREWEAAMRAERGPDWRPPGRHP